MMIDNLTSNINLSKRKSTKIKHSQIQYPQGNDIYVGDSQKVRPTSSKKAFNTEDIFSENNSPKFNKLTDDVEKDHIQI